MILHGSLCLHLSIANIPRRDTWTDQSQEHTSVDHKYQKYSAAQTMSPVFSLSSHLSLFAGKVSNNRNYRDNFTGYSIFLWSLLSLKRWIILPVSKDATVWWHDTRSVIRSSNLKRQSPGLTKLRLSSQSDIQLIHYNCQSDLNREKGTLFLLLQPLL